MRASLVTLSLTVALLLGHSCEGLAVPKGGVDGSSIIEELRRDLLLAQRLLGDAEARGGNHTSYPLHCSCEQYCQARCFSIGCIPCDASAFSFPGGESLCLSPGPLGGGLLCQQDGQTPCCTPSGPTCWLPSDCSDCSKYPPAPEGLFPKINRLFVNNTCIVT